MKSKRRLAYSQLVLGFDGSAQEFVPELVPYFRRGWHLHSITAGNGWIVVLRK